MRERDRDLTIVGLIVVKTRKEDAKCGDALQVKTELSLVASAAAAAGEQINNSHSCGTC